MTRRSTSTSAFGVSRREGHDASGFYGRFTRPEISSDSHVATHRALDKLMVGDARHMEEVPDASVALVVTSPPYFAGKEYEASLGSAGVPATYLEYLDLLRDVFGECTRVLEPGGRIAVNVANLGRRPYRSLAADVVGILQDDLRLLLRGEIVWVKQRGSSGSCAWGSFQRAGNPVLRDLSERVIVASKGRFDRALPPAVRARLDLPWESSMTRDDFMEDTLDIWEIPPESATRIGHPAPFPVELPARLIDLYTYRGDLVLDPFAGSGTVAVAAVRSGRHYAGYDLDPSYIRLAEGRVEAERRGLADTVERASLVVPSGASVDVAEAGRATPAEEGRSARDAARVVLGQAGFTDIRPDRRQVAGIVVPFVARDRRGGQWLFDVAGGVTTHRPGLERSEVLWKALGRAAVLHGAGAGPFAVLTAGLPGRRTPGAQALAQVTGEGKPIRAVVDLRDPSALARLRALCDGSDPVGVPSGA